MKYTTIPTLVMVIGSSFGASLLAQESAPATPIAPAASAGAAKTDTKTVNAVTDKATPTAKSQIEAATKVFDKKSAESVKMLQAEKDRAKQQELFSNRPSPKAVIDLILKLAKEDPKAEGIEDGLAWSVRRSNNTQRKVVAELLLTHYNDNEAISQLAYMYSRMWVGGEEGLRMILAKSGSEKVRQGATYYLASKLIKKDTKSEGLAMMKKLQKSPRISETNPKLLEQIKGELFVAENLSIGCTAPDIVGTDHEGKEFKLSDFRGKVVLLDFWGIW